MKIISKIVLIFIIILPLLIVLIWGMPGMNFEVPGNKLTETYLKIGDYKIGKQKFQYNICHKEKGCLNGNILGFESKVNDIYISINPNYSTVTGLENNEIQGFFYKLYNLDENLFFKKIYELPKYGYLSNNELKFYSENDLKNLPQEQQNIFKELEKNQTIIINGVDYTKK